MGTTLEWGQIKPSQPPRRVAGGANTGRHHGASPTCHGHKTLRALTDHDGNDIDPDAHRACPGHVVRVAQTWQRVFDHECDEHCEDNCRKRWASSHNVARLTREDYCDDWQAQGHVYRYADTTPAPRV